ncbi:nuclear RNA export factor 1/2 [Cryptococcus neoformans A1-35-8]|nr:nuclear RNA export factor 1/2 [Cryptococcus neoformans var. grubii A1-35-8]
MPSAALASLQGRRAWTSTAAASHGAETGRAGASSEERGRPAPLTRPAGTDHHRARHMSTNHTASPPPRAAQREEAAAVVSPTQAEHRRAHPQASLRSDRHLQRLKRTTRNRNCQESCRVQR